MSHLLLALAGLLAPGDVAASDAVRVAIEQPARYVETHAEIVERFSSPQAAATHPALPWLALVDALIARDLAIELDWNTDREELLSGIEGLAAYAHVPQGSRATLHSLRRDESATVGWLRDVADVVAVDGLVVATMDIDSDSYVVLLLVASDYLQASQDADRLGYMLKDIREHDPNQ